MIITQDESKVFEPYRDLAARLNSCDNSLLTPENIATTLSAWFGTLQSKPKIPVRRDSRTYERNVLYESTKLELVEIAWHASGSPHKHVNFESVTIVLLGSIVELQYKENDGDHISLVGISSMMAGETRCDRVGLIHKLIADEISTTVAVSVHVNIKPKCNWTGPLVKCVNQSVDLSIRSIVKNSPLVSWLNARQICVEAI